EWWRSATIYQLYPRSFASSGGPIGDLPGITARLPHLADLGVDAIWLSPFYVSPQNDGGYDVADYRDVDPLFGTLADADALITRAHDLGLRVIIDLVPNHTSDLHAWFRAALAAGPGSPERDRYVFRDGEQPPNNWPSIFGGPAWQRVCDRADAPGSPWEGDRGWYLHIFDPSQPDLNWENPEVWAEFRSILRFWLDRGVDGFRVDVAHGLVKRVGLPDWSGRYHMAEGTGEPAPMFDQEGVHEVYRDWHRVLAGYDGERMLVAEAWIDPPERLARYIRPDEMHQAFNFDFLASPWDAAALGGVIEATYRANDAVGAPSTWVLSNHDVVRHASRYGLPFTGKRDGGIGPSDPQPDTALGLRRARAAALLMLALAGSAYLYQGEELGLPEHTTIPDSARQDPAFVRSGGAFRGRDGCRVPLPWETDAPAFGFSPDGATWLPQPPEWARLAVDVQRDDPASTLSLYRAALRLRRTWDLGGATLEWEQSLCGDGVLAFRSTGDGRPDVLVVTTMQAEAPLPAGWDVALASG
ncbi:MAG: glycoside hydrolase family 13 protein, partial [Actinomycetes bacterium]|nr:glycoside hydrolase family 13 protein [Actinomycetes bacterium]